MNKVFLFPGQGSQYVGMGKNFYEKFDFAKKIYKQAEEILDCNISEISFTETAVHTCTRFQLKIICNLS